jgi:mono/diheme cytochrome c family protein
MRRAWWLLAGAATAAITAVAIGVVYLRITGLDSQSHPGGIETSMAGLARRLAIPHVVTTMRNPVALTPEVLAEGMAHFADHCANCHADNGSGNTEMGRGLYPRAPDMRLAATQNLTDGELAYVIEHGIRFTGMPAWSTGTKAGAEATWYLVHFIRHLPRLTDAELERMKELTPRSPDEIRREIEEERFLNEGSNQ